MIRTSSYSNFNSLTEKSCSVSGDRGLAANYKGKCYPALAPKKEFWSIWENNIDVVSEPQNNMYYVSEYYKQVLSPLDPLIVFKQLDGSTLLCYEDSEAFCHRHIIAEWFRLTLDEDVPEVVVKDSEFVRVQRPNDIGEMLESVMRDNMNMRGMSSIRAAYLLNKSDMLDEEASLQEKRTGNSFDQLREQANEFRSIADEIEYGCKKQKSN